MSALAFSVFIYIFPASESIHIDLDSFGIGFLNREIMENGTTENKKMEENYKKESARIVGEYLNLTENPEYKPEQIGMIKQELLDLIVPTKFKDLHLNLVLAMSQMEIFSNAQAPEAKTASQELITEAKANYAWLSQ